MSVNLPSGDKDENGVVLFKSYIGKKYGQMCIKAADLDNNFSRLTIQPDFYDVEYAPEGVKLKFKTITYVGMGGERVFLLYQ